MSDTRALRVNEQIKAMSNLILNLDAVSIAALAYRVSDAGRFDLLAAVWFFAVSFATYVGVRMLSLLEAED